MADSDTKTLTVRVTYKQHEWVKLLSDDMRCGMDDVIQMFIQERIDAQESGDSSSFQLRKLFRQMVKNQPEDRIRRAKLLLAELDVMVSIAEKEEEARDLRLKLLAKHEQYHNEFGGSPPSMLEDE